MTAALLANMGKSVLCSRLFFSGVSDHMKAKKKLINMRQLMKASRQRTVFDAKTLLGKSDTA